MSQSLLLLESVSANDIMQVGGKAAGLGALKQASFPVLPGLCIPTMLFRQAMGERQAQIDALLGQFDLQQPTAAARAAQQIEAICHDLALPAPITPELEKLLAAIAPGNRRWAVRSSATIEDQANASFAGQFATILGAPTAAIPTSIATCWRSFFSPNALMARAAQGGLDNAAMAVLIQPMLDAECAGVCFTIDPVQQRDDQLIVEAAWGLGAGLVDGLVQTDRAWVRRRDFGVEQRQIVEKREQVALAPTAGVHHITVPPERQRAACLPEAWLQRLAQFGLAAEQFFGAPQDIEWAIAEQQVWMLQSRPITALPPNLTNAPTFPVAWADANERCRPWTLDELPISPYRPPLPLEMDCQLAVESIRTEACRQMGVERNQQTKLVNGYLYVTPVPLGLPPGDMRIRRAAWNDWRNRLTEQGITAWDLWGPEIIQATQRLAAFALTKADNQALAEHLENALGAYRRHWMLHPLCWFQPQPAFYAAYRAVTGRPDATKEETQQLLVGAETQLTRLVDGLYELAQLAQDTPGLAALLTTKPTDLRERLAAWPEATPFYQRLTTFLAHFGERNGDGYGSHVALTTATWREEPGQVLDLVARYLTSNVEAPSLVRQRVRQERDAAVEALCAACANVSAVAEFQRQLAIAQRSMAGLEDHNHYIDQLATGQLRLAALTAADQLVEQSVLASRESIFWLHFEEIFEALRTEAPISRQPLIVERQTQHAAWAKLAPPPLLGVPTAMLPPRPSLQDETTKQDRLEGAHIYGEAASRGRGQGRARIVRNPGQLLDITPGDVLVAENVGPLWTPLFPLLGGLVLEDGALLQHAATTAREYGIPAVINARYATARIQEGVWVTVDGAKEVVEIS